MKCPNPLCGNIIPDDSKFCPDCGTKIEDIDKIRKECKSFVDAHRQGYTKALEEGRIPQFSEYLSLDGYKNILSSTLVVKYQQEYDYEQSEERKREKRAQEELKHCRDEVHKIYTRNSLGYNSLAKYGKFASYCDDFNLGQCHRVLRYREEIVKEQKRLEEEMRILNALRKEVEELNTKYLYGYIHAMEHANVPGHFATLTKEQCQEVLKLKDYIIRSDARVRKRREKKERRNDAIFSLLWVNLWISLYLSVIIVIIQVVLTQGVRVMSPSLFTSFSLFGLDPLLSLYLASYLIVSVKDIPKLFS